MHGITRLTRRVAALERVCSPRYGFASRAPSLSRAKSTSAVKPYYITTPIFYPNAEPHIGHLHSLIIADILARYQRIASDRPVHFMTGTDEHGLKIQRAAEARGMEPQAFCDELSESFRNLAEKAEATNTMFARTTDKKHCDAVHHLWRALDSKGLIYKGQHSGWYSVQDECFYTDLQVTEVNPGKGENPHHIAVETRSRVEWQEETNYKFRLSAFREALHAHYTAHPEAIYPQQHHSDVLLALSQPLEDLSVSRPRTRLTWGVPVPDDPEHTIYVWIDALTVYLSSVGYPFGAADPKGAAAGWPPNVQVMGKDIVRFHAIYLPAMLHALDLPFSERLLCHSHWTVDQAKMSKSVGNVADPIEAMNKYGVDVVRYYLARVGGRFKDDVDWSHKQLEKFSKEIIAAFGNLYARNGSAKILSRIEGLDRPSLDVLANDELTASLVAEVRALPAAVESHMSALEVADALLRIVSVLKKANVLITHAAPWNKKTPEDVALKVHVATLHALRVGGVLLQPFMPAKTALVLDQIGVTPEQRTLAAAKSADLPLGPLKERVKVF